MVHASYDLRLSNSLNLAIKWSMVDFVSGNWINFGDQDQKGNNKQLSENNESMALLQTED